MRQHEQEPIIEWTVPPFGTATWGGKTFRLESYTTPDGDSRSWNVLISTDEQNYLHCSGAVCPTKKELTKYIQWWIKQYERNR